MEPTNSNDKAIRGNPRTHSTTNRRTQHLPRPKRDRSPSMGPPPKSVPITPPPATPSETIPHDGRQNYLFPRPGFASPQQKAASRRNDEQLDAAVIISKYLLARPNSFITATITGPDDHFTPPRWLMEAIRAVASASVPTPKKPPVDFRMSHEAAAYNSALLETCQLDLERFLQNHHSTTLNYGSEFRPIPQLQQILGSHPNFDEIKRILQHGMDHRFGEAISEEKRST
jgi:hypothetical protein